MTCTKPDRRDGNVVLVNIVLEIVTIVQIRGACGLHAFLIVSAYKYSVNIGKY